MNKLLQEFKKSFIRAWKCYFVPLTAIYFAMTRKGSYFWYLKALYRLTEKIK